MICVPPAMNQYQNIRRSQVSSLRQGLVLFNIVINRLVEGISMIWFKFADGTKTGKGVANTYEDSFSVQRDDTLENWVRDKKIKFSRDKCKVAYLRNKA